MNNLPFEWEDGEVIEQAYVTINGEKYYVTPATYSGGTSLSANHLNQMEVKILEKNILTSALDSDFTLTTTGSYDIIPLTQKTQIGTKLSVTNDGGIKIGSGVSHIKVYSTISYQSIASANAKWNTIFKNTSAVFPVPTYASNRITLTNPGGIIPVSENDIIYLKTQGTSGDVIRGSLYNYYTNLTVEVVD